METTRRFRILSVCLCVLTWTGLSFSQTPSEPNVVFSIEEWVHWAPVFGADAPAFTLYDSRDLIYFDRQAYEYVCVHLSEGEYTRLLEDIVPGDLSMLDDGYMRAWVTCQNVYYFYFGAAGRMVYVYGHPTASYGDDEGDFQIPQSLRRCFNTVERYRNSRAARWVPERIEVIVWDAFPTDQQFVPWPSDWPDLNSPDTIRRSQVWSVYLPAELYDAFMALLEESEGVVTMNGRPMVIWYRLPIPGEGVFDQTPDESARPGSSDSPLHIAARRGNLESVTSLVASGADVNVQNSDGSTPLHYAASEGYCDVVEYLIANGADVNTQDKEGQTPLHLAICWMYDDVVRLLLANGADIDVEARHGKTALHLATEWGWEDTAELVISLGANIEARTAYGNTPLLCALDFREPNLAALLLGSGADVSVRNDANDTALHYATDDILADVASELLSAGLDPNARNDANDTPLYSAARDGAARVVELLLTQGADVRAAKPDGRTALHAAAFQGHADVVALLLSHGADVNAATDEGQTPLDCALGAGRDDVAAQLRAAGGKTGAEEEPGLAVGSLCTQSP